MKSTIMKLTDLPEKWLRNAAQIADMLRYFFYHIMALFSILTTSFVLSLVSAATYFKDNPEQPYLPPHELLLQAWDNATDLAFNTSLVYFAIVYATLAIKYLLKKQKEQQSGLETTTLENQSQ